MAEVITDHLDLWTSALPTKSTPGRGSNGKLEAYGIKKLRELILELAVRGKLVPQDPNDEPASVLLTKVLKENARLQKERNKKPSEVPVITNDEITFQLPHGWEYVRNGSLFSLRKGKKPKNISESEIGLPYLDIEALDRNNVLRFTDDDKCPCATEEDILVVCDGSRSGLVLNGKNGVIGSTLAVIDTPKLIQPFIKLLFMESYERLNSTMKGAAIPHLDTSRLILEVVGLPPLNEQHRIVAKVDELMALCDQLEQQQTDSLAAHQTLVETLLGTLTRVESQQEFSAAWTRIASHFDILFTTGGSIDQLKQTILQLAVMGKLVPQDLDDEPASVFLEKVAQEKAKLIKAEKIRKQKELPEIKDDDIGFNLPAGWAVSRLGTFTNVGTGATPSRDKAAYWSPQEVNWVASGETSNDFITETSERISSLAVKETNVTVYPVGTLIVAMYGQGKTRGQVSELMIEAGTNQACAAVLLINEDEAHRKYLKLFFKKAYEEMRSHSAGGAQPNLNVGKISNTVVPIPPLAEQHRIVAKVDELMALCDALKARLADAQAIQLHLADAIVEQAVC